MNWLLGRSEKKKTRSPIKKQKTKVEPVKLKKVKVEDTGKEFIPKKGPLVKRKPLTQTQVDAYLKKKNMKAVAM